MTTSVPTVVDADGINAIAQDPGTLKAAKAPIVLTPHPGEMARLTGLSVQEIKLDRLNIALRVAAQWGKIVVLKGARTIIADPSGVAYINTTGNSGMATAGSGDVLTGIIAGLLAQGIRPLEASVLGVYVHGLAGDIASSRYGEMGMTATDILGSVPEALLRLTGERGEKNAGCPGDRPTIAEIDLACITRNMQAIRKAVGLIADPGSRQSRRLWARSDTYSANSAE